MTEVLNAQTLGNRQGRSVRILLAEDELSNQFPTRRMLEKAGYEVLVAENGRQVLELVERNDFDCILMDIQMPVMSGLDATRAIRSSEHLGRKRTVPIIALTAYAMDGDRDVFLREGMNAYLAKPILMEDLFAVLEKVIDTSGSEVV